MDFTKYITEIVILGVLLLIALWAFSSSLKQKYRNGWKTVLYSFLVLAFPYPTADFVFVSGDLMKMYIGIMFGGILLFLLTIYTVLTPLRFFCLFKNDGNINAQKRDNKILDDIEDNYIEKKIYPLTLRFIALISFTIFYNFGMQKFPGIFRLIF